MWKYLKGVKVDWRNQLNENTLNVLQLNWSSYLPYSLTN